MQTKEAMPRPGYFQWDGAAWFGSQIGGTAWMLVGAIVLVPHAPEVAVVWLICFAVANVTGTSLWLCRDRLSPYPGLQALLLVCGVSGLIALVGLHLLRPGLVVRGVLGFSLVEEPWSILCFLVLVVSLMTRFHLMERGARRNRSRSEEPTSPLRHHEGQDRR